MMAQEELDKYCLDNEGHWDSKNRNVSDDIHSVAFDLMMNASSDVVHKPHDLNMNVGNLSAFLEYPLVKSEPRLYATCPHTTYELVLDKSL